MDEGVRRVENMQTFDKTFEVSEVQTVTKLKSADRNTQ